MIVIFEMVGFSRSRSASFLLSVGGGGSRSICDWTLSSQAFDVGLMAVKGQHNISVTVCTIHWFQVVKKCRLGSGMSEAGSSYSVRTLSQ